MHGVVETNVILDADNKRLQDQVTTLKTAANNITLPENRIGTAEARLQFCRTHHGSVQEYEDTRQTLVTRVSTLERECTDLKRKYNRVANTNLDLHPLRMDQPGNLAEIVDDLQQENHNLRADLEIARRIVPSPDLQAVNREINRLRTRGARCQVEKDNLQQQIIDQRYLATMSEDDQRVALRLQVDGLQNELETKKYEADALGILVRQLNDQIRGDLVVQQGIRADLVAAHAEIQKLRLAAQANEAARSIRPRLRMDEVAYEVLEQLCLLLEDGLQRVAALPSTSSIPRLVRMTPNDKQWLTAQHIGEFMTLAFDLIPVLTNNDPTDAKQAGPPIDLDAILTREPIVRLGEQLQYALDGCKSRPTQDLPIQNAFEEMIRVHYHISQNDEGLRAQIRRLEKDIMDAQSQKNAPVDCLQWTTALRQLNEQAVSALPDIGFDEKPPPAFGAAEYIRDSVMFIQTLRNRIGSLEQGGPEITAPIPESDPGLDSPGLDLRQEEWDIYNQLVKSHNDFYYFLDANHGNDVRVIRLGKRPRMWLRIIGESVSLIEIHNLLQVVREMRDLIRGLGQEKGWRGSQIDWVAPQSGWEDAKYLSRALATADDIIVGARTLLDQNGPNYAPEKTAAAKPPNLTASAVPENRISVTQAGIVIEITMDMLNNTIQRCFGRDINTDIDFSVLADLDPSAPIDQDTLFKLGQTLKEMADCTQGQDQSQLTEHGSLSLGYALSEVEKALLTAENALTGYEQAGRSVSSEAAKLKFKKRHSRPARGAGVSATTDPPATPRPNSRRRSSSTPLSPTFYPASTAAPNITGVYPIPQFRAEEDPASSCSPPVQTSDANPGWAPATPPCPSSPAVPQWQPPAPNLGHIRNSGGPDIVIPLGRVFPVGAAPLSPVSNPRTSPAPRHPAMSEDVEEEL